MEPAACRIQPQAGCRWQGGEAELALTQLSSGMEGSVCQRAPSTSHPPTPNAVRLHRPAQISQRETSHICLQSRCVLMHPGCILSPFPRSFHKKKKKIIWLIVRLKLAKPKRGCPKTQGVQRWPSLQLWKLKFTNSGAVTSLLQKKIRKLHQPLSEQPWQLVKLGQDVGADNTALKSCLRAG